MEDTEGRQTRVDALASIRRCDMKNLFGLIAGAFVAAVIMGCVPKSKYDAAMAENTQLKEELESLKRTDTYYYQEIANAFSEKRYADVKAEAEALLLKFPPDAVDVGCEKTSAGSRCRYCIGIQGRTKHASGCLKKGKRRCVIRGIG